MCRRTVGKELGSGLPRCTQLAEPGTVSVTLVERLAQILIWLAPDRRQGSRTRKRSGAAIAGGWSRRKCGTGRGVQLSDAQGHEEDAQNGKGQERDSEHPPSSQEC